MRTADWFTKAFAKAVATSVGLDIARFDKDFDDTSASAAQISDRQRDAEAHQFTGTPSILVTGLEVGRSRRHHADVLGHREGRHEDGRRMSFRRVEAGLAVVAFLIAGYLTYERHQGQNALCPVGGGGCETVAHSSYSKFAGVPVSYFGMLGALTLFALCFRSELLFSSLRFVVTGVGAAFSALPHLARGDEDQRLLRVVPRQRDGLVHARDDRRGRPLAARPSEPE